MTVLQNGSPVAEAGAGAVVTVDSNSTTTLSSTSSDFSQHNQSVARDGSVSSTTQGPDGRTVQTRRDFTDQYGWEDELIIDLPGGASVAYIQDDLGAVTVQMTGQTLSGSEFGAVLGSSIGRILGRELGDNPFVAAGASTLLGAVGQYLGQAMQSAGFFTPVSSSLSINFGGDGPLLSWAVNEAAQSAAPGFTGNLMSVGLGQLGSFLFSALAEEIGLDGFANTAFVSVGTTITSTLGNNLVHMAAGDLIEGQPYTLFTNFNPAGLFTSMGGAVAGYFASQLAAEIVNPDSELSSTLGSIGSSIGGFLGSFIPIPVLGSAIGSFVGQLAGTIAGNLISDDPHAIGFVYFGPSNPHDPESPNALTAWGFGDDDGGDWHRMQAVADRQVQAVNALVAFTGGQIDPATTQVDFTYSQDGDFFILTEPDPSGVGYNVVWSRDNVTAPEQLAGMVDAGAMRMIERIDITGGDPLMRAAWENSNATNLSAFAADLQVAADYRLYLDNYEIINALIAAEPDSAFTAGWVITLLRAEELNLDSALIGDSGANTIQGFDGRDPLAGLGGDDTLQGLGGDDRLDGGSGNDRLEGGDGNDILIGGADADYMDGGNGIDIADYRGTSVGVSVDLRAGAMGGGAAGDQLISVENLWGTNFADTLSGTDGANVILGFGGNDTLYGYDGDDRLEGGAGNDTVGGAVGNDVLLGGLGDDTLDGHTGDDTLIGGRGADVLNGGSGFDTVDYSQDETGAAVVVDLVAGTADNGSIDTLSEIERIIGTRRNDTIRADNNANTLLGLAGLDLLDGRGGNDVLEGGDGDDRLFGGLGNDTLNGGAGIDTADYGGSLGGTGVVIDLRNGTTNGAAGNDTLSGIENVVGSDFNDDLHGNDGANLLQGASGNDTLYGYGAIDRLEGMAGNDILNGGDGDDLLHGGDDADTISGDAGNDLLVGGRGGDTLTGGTGTDTVDYGQDETGAAVVVDLVAGTANNGSSDTLSGIENVIGSAFADTLTGDAGDNVLEGGAGADTLAGGGGSDTASYAASSAGVTVSLAAGTGTGGDAEGDTLSEFENILGSVYADNLTGDGGANVLDGGLGDDALDGGAGADQLTGGDGTDTASYANATAGIFLDLRPGGTGGGDAAGDTLTGIERIIGSAFADNLEGSSAGEYLAGNDGNDRIAANDGDDRVAGGLGADLLFGGTGIDTVDYLDGPAVTVDLAAGTATDSSGTDTLSGFERIIGSEFGDTLSGDDGANKLDGASGNDVLDGRGGNDRLEGGGGDDRLIGGAGIDELYGQSGIDTADYTGSGAAVAVNLLTGAVSGGDAQGDTLDSIEDVWGSEFADTLTGNDEQNRLRGFGGNDTLTGNGGNDLLEGMDGDDWLLGGLGADTLLGGNGNDSLVGGAGADILDGGAGANLARYDDAPTGVIARLDNPALNTGDAAGDTYTNILGFSGSNFADMLVGDAGNNQLYGIGGIDSLYGLAGNDLLGGGDGDDHLYGGAGADIYDGGAGFDTARYDDAASGVTARLDNPSLNTGEALGDTYTGIEALVGSYYTDVLVGDGANNRVDGLDGDDELWGQAGDDALFGGNGSDRLLGGAGADVLDGGADFDWARYDYATAGVTARLDNPGLNTGEAAGDTYTSIEGLVGSAYADTLYGDAAANAIHGLDGNDWLYGGLGADYLYGENGNDSLLGGAGADILDGGAGSNLARYDDAPTGVTARLDNPALNTGDAAGDSYTNIQGFAGSSIGDVLVGDAGNNQLYGNGGGDSLYGLAGSDDLVGGDGDDHLFGGAGADVLDGGAGFDTARYDYATAGVMARLDSPSLNTGEAAGDTYTGIEALVGSYYTDTLVGDGANNRIDGLDGDDQLRGEAGNDALFGGNGSDQLIGGAGADALDGGADFDWARYDYAAAGVTARLDNPGLNSGEAAGDTYTAIEGLVGSAYADTLYGDAAANAIHGLDGNDSLYGGLGADYLYGENGNDSLLGGAGADILDGGAGSDTASYAASSAGVTVSLATGLGTGGDAQSDTLTGFENIAGSDFVDQLTGDAGANVLTGGLGDDHLFGSAGADVLDGGAGFDYARYDYATAGVMARLDSPSLNTGEAAGDSYTGIEALVGSGFNDVLVGDGASNRLDGLDGHDDLRGQAGNDALFGGNGSDQLMGGAGADVLDGGADFDWARYDGATAGVTARLDNPGLNTGEAAGDTYTGIEGLVGSAFADTLYGDAAANNMHGLDGNDMLNGGLGGDYLYGGNGNDNLSGGGGTDVLDGGAGDDTYTVDHAADQVIESAGAGGDTVYSSIAYALSSNVENLILVEGAGAISGSGNGADNYLFGNSAANTLDGSSGNDALSGNAGDDTIIGGAGSDGMSGGAGRDFFAFVPGFGQDTIADFTPGTDAIVFDHTIFSSFADVVAHASQSGASTVIMLNANNYVVLNNVQVSSLQQNDFYFS